MASLASRKIKMPAKKQIKETVPFSNKTYDFSDINGEVYWEERELEYIFEITAETPELLEELKLKFADWIMNIKDEEIHDPFISDYHFKGTYEDLEFEDDEGLDKTTATVKFLAYPYKISNIPKIYEITVSAGENKKVILNNESSHRVTAIFETMSGENIAVKFNDETISIMSSAQYAFMINKGITNINVEGDGVLRITFSEEVF